MANKETITEQAMELRRDAALIRATKDSERDCLAEAYDRSAREMMQVDATSLSLISGEVDPHDNIGCINTLEQPDAAAVEASCTRTRLLRNTNTTDLGIDAANSIQAQTSIEKMLAHQMAVCHQTSLELMQEATSPMYGVECDKINIIKTRKLNSANRLMQTFQQAMLTLQKVRTGGKQTVVVQHVDRKSVV